MKNPPLKRLLKNRWKSSPKFTRACVKVLPVLGLWCGILFFAFFFSGEAGSTGKDTFTQESLYYRVSIKGIPIGEQVLKVVGEATYEGHPVYCIQTELRSYPAISLLFRYRENGLLYLDKEGLFPRYSLREIEEQRRKKKEETLFYPEKGEVIHRVTKNGQETEKTYSLSGPACQDNLSLVYYFRTRPWEKGEKTFYFLTLKGPVEVEYSYLGPEEVDTPYRKFTADKIDDPVSRITVWFSKDEKTYPVKITVGQDAGTINSLLMKVK